MPITAAAAVPSLITGAASIYGANRTARASSKAAQQALALQQQQYQQARNDAQPYMQAGQAGLNALQSRLLGGGGTGGAGAGQAADPGMFGNTANPSYTPTSYTGPTYQAPPAFNYTAADYQASPGFEWMMKRGLGAINSANAHNGSMDSGAAAKSLTSFAQGLAAQDFNNQRQFAFDQYDSDRNFGRNAFVSDRDFGRNAYDMDANRARANYENDRNYLTNRFDAQTSNLNGLATMGQKASQGLVDAGMNVAKEGGAGLIGAGKTTGAAWMTGADAAGSMANAVYDAWRTKGGPR